MNEEKVREAIRFAKQQDDLCKPILQEPTTWRQFVTILEEAIAPDAPEIPEGCPVLVGHNEGEIDQERFYYRGLEEGHTCLEIDYQRAEEQFAMLAKLLSERKDEH